MYLVGERGAVQPITENKHPENSGDSERVRRGLSFSSTEGPQDGPSMLLIVSLHHHLCLPATKQMALVEEASSPLHCSGNKEEHEGRGINV